MRSNENHAYFAYEQFLVEAMREVASELRLIDLQNLVLCVSGQRRDMIKSLIEAATELYFAPDTIRYADFSEVSMSWEGMFQIKFDFEFRNKGVRIYFSMLLRTATAAIHVNYVAIGDNATSMSDKAKVLAVASALISARTRPTCGRLAWWADTAQPRARITSDVFDHIDLDGLLV